MEENEILTLEFVTKKEKGKKSSWHELNLK